MSWAHSMPTVSLSPTERAVPSPCGAGDYSKAMLERDRVSVQAIASHVGHEDVSFFRTLFKRLTGMTPGDYRNHFGKLSVRKSAAPDTAA